MKKVAEIRQDVQWVIFTNDSYTSDHGYPEDGSTTYPFISTQFFTDKTAWLRQIEIYSLRNDSFKAAEIKFAEVVKTVVVNVK